MDEVEIPPSKVVRGITPDRPEPSSLMTEALFAPEGGSYDAHGLFKWTSSPL